MKTIAVRLPDELGSRQRTAVFAEWLPVGLAVLLALVLFGLQVSVAGGGTRDYDEGVYWQALRSLASGHRLFQDVFAPQGPAFFYGLLPFYLLGHSIETIRWGIAFFSLLALAALFISISAVAGRWPALFGLALLGTDPLWFHESVTLHAEVPALAWALVALAFAALAARRTESHDQGLPWLAVASGACFALGMGSKAFVVLFAIPIAFLLLGSGFRVAQRNKLVPALIGFLGMALIMFLPFVDQAGTVIGDLVTVHFRAGAAFRHGVAYNFRLIHLGRELPLEGLACLLLLFALFRRQRIAFACLAWLAATVIALLLYQPLFPHEVTLLMPVLAFTSGSSLVSLRPFGPPAVAVAGLAVLVVALLAFNRDRKDLQVVAQPNTHDLAMAAAVARLSEPGEYVIGDNPYAIALANRDTPPYLVDQSFARISAHFLTRAQIEQQAQQYRVRVFVFDGGRLASVPGLQDWVAARYPQLITPATGGRIYVRE